MSKTKIFVFKKKKLIYGALAILAAIIIIIILAALAKQPDTTDEIPDNTQDTALYVPGVYSTVIALNDTYLNLEVVVDAAHINSVRIVNPDEAVTTMYPLVESSISSISDQLCNDVPLASVTFNEESKYTQAVLLDAVKVVLEKAAVDLNR